jgi:hypothetical protein
MSFQCQWLYQWPARGPAQWASPRSIGGPLPRLVMVLDEHADVGGPGTKADNGRIL